jgi:hypothetical protein
MPGMQQASMLKIFMLILPHKKHLKNLLNMKINNLMISTRMAVIMGVFLPFIETIRRSNQLLDPTKFLNWFDDYMLGGVLLIAVYLVKKKANDSISLLIASWGFASGALFLSLLAQFDIYSKGDPGIFPTELVALGKGVILVYMLTGLFLAVKSNSHIQNNLR